MIKRTPQDIADFFGCYVAQTYNGDWFVHTDKPVMHKGAWVSHTGIGFPNQMVEAPDDHDWIILYKPGPVSEKADSDNDESDVYKEGRNPITDAPHQSAVHVHQEYTVFRAEDIQELEAVVNESIPEGWRPIGGIAVYHDLFYQAMVRGLP